MLSVHLPQRKGQVSMQQEGPMSGLKSRPHQCCWHLDLGRPASGTVRKCISKPRSLRYFVMQPDRLTQLTHQSPSPVDSSSPVLATTAPFLPFPLPTWLKVTLFPDEWKTLPHLWLAPHIPSHQFLPRSILSSQTPEVSESDR